MKLGDSRYGASFSWKNRVARVAWGLAYAIVFRPSPRFLHSWRRLILKTFGARIGPGAHVYPKVVIWAPWNLRIDDRAGVGDGVILYSQGAIFIGKDAVISQGVHLCTGTHLYEDPGFPLVTKPIHIGAGAWLAAETFVHPGVTIGEGAVIGARSVVTKDMPPWTVCAGHPCKPLKPRAGVQSSAGTQSNSIS